MIFTVVFKVMICKTTYRKLTDKKLEGSLEVSDITAKMVKPLYVEICNNKTFVTVA